MSYLSRFEDWAQNINYDSETEYETVQATIAKFKAKLSADPEMEESTKVDLQATIESMILALDSFDCHVEPESKLEHVVIEANSGSTSNDLLSLEPLGDPADPNARPLTKDEKKVAVSRLLDIPGISLGFSNGKNS